MQFKVIEKEKRPKMSSQLLCSAFILCSLLLFGTGQAAVRYYDLVLMESNFTKVCESKTMLTANGTFPGPELFARKGDTLYVTVYNQGTYGVTIHWHGVKQPRNPWSDGPENITQCPIQPGSNFTQQVILSTEEGTLWWHAHSDWTRATVHGAIKILPALGTTYPFTEPYQDHTILLASWYKSDVMTVIETAMATGADPNTSDAFTINGHPGDLYDCSTDDVYRLSVVAGKTYLLRIINAILNEEMYFSIANHNLTVVGMDGAYLKPFTIDTIMIVPGQTIDVLLTADQSPSHYYIGAIPFADTTASYNNSTASAIVEYVGNYTPPSSPPFPSLPISKDPQPAQHFVDQLKSLADNDHPVSVPKNVTKRILMTVSVNLMRCPNSSCAVGGDRMSGSLTNQSFQTFSIDVLQAYVKNISGIYTADFPLEPEIKFNYTGETNQTVYTGPGSRVIMLEWGEVVELVWQGTNIGNTQNHPMHLHGFSFYLVGIGVDNFDNETSPSNYNLVDPPEVNTIGLPTKGWLAVRFVADNPGVWFMHCHLERHASWGMSTVIIVKNGSTEETSMLPAPAYMPPCAGS